MILRSRWQLTAVVVLASCCVAAAAILISTHNSNGETLHGSRLIKHVDSLLAGIPESGTRLGSASAPITVTYFGDLECPVCQRFTLSGGFPQLVRTDVRDGKAKVIYRSFCSATCAGPGMGVFDDQQTAAYAAGEQGKFWYYAELFYNQQGIEGSGYVTTAFLDKLADQTSGLNVTRWKDDRHATTLLNQVKADDEVAADLKLQGTPTIIIEGPGGAALMPQVVPDFVELQRTITRLSK